MTSQDNLYLSKIENQLKSLAKEAGESLLTYFGKPLEIEYKDLGKTDPVTEADKNVQDLLKISILKSFPDHAVIGEEDQPGTNKILPKYVWVIDPLDGTRNFSNGLRIFACSIGVLCDGIPIAGAIFIPTGDKGGDILHAVIGKGAYLNDKPINISNRDSPDSLSLVGLPGSFHNSFRFTDRIKGEPRILGSIAYELAMVATGVFQYSALLGSLAIWDVAAGLIIIKEAGGSIKVGNISRKKAQWSEFDSFYKQPQKVIVDMATLRKWHAPLIFGSTGIVNLISQKLEYKSGWKQKLSNLLKI
ncbi:MAG: myo-inositol-1(or 4)-monophosphatase [Chloroflexi bacterium]|nr:MAG: myo-inositol-1(or 4)-monophosphatase [Chloroflexota bacterium]